MNSLNVNVTTKQYELRWSGLQTSSNYTSSNLGGLFNDEKSMNDYLDQKVSEGWIILETSVNVFEPLEVK
jgi:hypothetical protein